MRRLLRDPDVQLQLLKHVLPLLEIYKERQRQDDLKVQASGDHPEGVARLLTAVAGRVSASEPSSDWPCSRRSSRENPPPIGSAAAVGHLGTGLRR